MLLSGIPLSCSRGPWGCLGSTLGLRQPWPSAQLAPRLLQQLSR